METDDSIYFYGHKNKFGYMSNFYPCSFTIRRLGNIETYNCSEQYFMAAKCRTFDPNNINLLNKIMNETNPMKIKMLGRQVKNFDDDVWNMKRQRIMFKELLYKFKSNPDLKNQLLETYPKKLYEASPRDKVWGIGMNTIKAINIDPSKYGQNLLGKILESVRDLL